MTTLAVLIDGEALPGEEAVSFWKRFSTWMEEHPGDLGGFATSEGLVSVQPEMHAGSPVLVASRSAPQKPYTSAPKRATPATGGGSRGVHGKGPRNGAPAKKRRH
jgi:hypothetical protein